MHFDTKKQLRVPGALQLLDLCPGIEAQILHYDYFYPDPITIERIIDNVDPIIIYNTMINGIVVPSYFYASELTMRPNPVTHTWSTRKCHMRMDAPSYDQEMFIKATCGRASAARALNRRQDIHPGTRVGCLI